MGARKRLRTLVEDAVIVEDLPGLGERPCDYQERHIDADVVDELGSDHSGLADAARIVERGGVAPMRVPIRDPGAVLHLAACARARLELSPKRAAAQADLARRNVVDAPSWSAVRRPTADLVRGQIDIGDSHPDGRPGPTAEPPEAPRPCGDPHWFAALDGNGTALSLNWSRFGRAE